MTYGQVRDHVLMLLNQYTIAGSAVEPSYNNQQDYLARIPALVSTAGRSWGRRYASRSPQTSTSWSAAVWCA